MKFKTPLNLKETADFLNANYKGKDNHKISGLNEIHMVEKGDIVFVDHPKYYDKALNSNATTILINKEVDYPDGKAIIISQDPFKDFLKLINKYAPISKLYKSKGDNLLIGENSHIQPNVTIGHNVVIGKNCFIHAGVTINDNTIIGDNVIIHANSSIGNDAFYYQFRNGAYEKLLSCGNVLIESNVEIGALCTIDRGVTGTTTIKTGCKLDNQVHVGHDTFIDEHCLIAAQVGIAGCCIIEKNCKIWGQVGIPANITIGEKSEILGQTGITNHTKGNQKYFGSPAGEVRSEFKLLALYKKLPQLFDRVSKLEKNGK